MKVLIIGGVAGGASTATRLRRLCEEVEITLIEKGPFVSFANCGLPYHIGGVIEEKDELLLQTPESLKRRFNFDVLVNTEATNIDRQKKQVTIKKFDGTTEILSYDKLVLSTGAKAFVPNLPGIDAPGIFTLQTIPEMERIIEWIRKNKVKKTTVIGAGFIGLEVAENLILKGIEVTVIEMDKQVLPPIDPEMANILSEEIKNNGVILKLQKQVTGFSKKANNIIEVNIANEPSIETDMVILSIGVRPRTELAVKSGLSIGKFGGIEVNEKLETSDPDIYALGDVIEVTNPITILKTYIPLAGPANRQGRIVADNIMGNNRTYDGTIGTSICKVFNKVVAATGASEKLLKRNNIPFKKVITHSGSHAGYYPGASIITLKLIYNEETGKILGAQAVGMEGVDKRIDVIATAIKGGMTVFDLENLELCYAPPFNSAKDPVNISGFVASNAKRNSHENTISCDELLNLKDAILLDVRTKREFSMGNIQGSINIPVDDLRARIKEIPKDKEIIVYCQVGYRGYIAERILTNLGYKAKNLLGGYRAWGLSS